MQKIILSIVVCCYLINNSFGQTTEKQNSVWPQVKKEMRPWTRWWWMGSAVDEKNIERLLTAYQVAGFGGVEITPIYGAIGFEKRYIDFLSPKWISMLDFTVQKSRALGMGVDMNTGTGWPFGGPQIKPEFAASKLIIQTYTLKAGQTLQDKLVVKDVKQQELGAPLQAVTAYGDKGEVLSLLDKVDNEGNLNWVPVSGNWQIYAAFDGKTQQQVKRAAPGGEGYVMNHFDKKAVDMYLKRFDDIFQGKSAGVRAFFNDSYEVFDADWSPNFFDEFQHRRRYQLQEKLRELVSKDSTETIGRLKSDYRETMSQVLLDNFTSNWTNWTHRNKSISRNQSHGSPGNLLDLYGTVDIPECETFGSSKFSIPGIRRDSMDIRNVDPDPMMFKFASSAGNFYGKPFISSETFTWLTDHFKTAYSQCKPEVEQLFLSGVNHVFFAGTTYSPKDIAFPGWLFYASVEFVPFNSLWSHLNGMNEYITRCQSVLQAGKADNELMVYWPVYDIWNNPEGMDMPLQVHNVDVWLHPFVFYKTVTKLQKQGYSLDYVSDKMIGQCQIKNGHIQTGSNASAYQVLIIPQCKIMPLETLENIMLLAKNGATVVIQSFPEDIPGLSDLENKRKKFKRIISGLSFTNRGNGIGQLKTGKGQILVSADVQKALEFAHIYREKLSDLGLKFIRRAIIDGKYYYIVNHTAKAIDSYIPLNFQAGLVLIMDPQNGNYGLAKTKLINGLTNARIQMQPGEALFLRSYYKGLQELKAWEYIGKPVDSIAFNKEWLLHFTTGGPELPSDQKLTDLISWTSLSDPKAIAFSGSGEYTTSFDIRGYLTGEYLLQIGKVYESAHIWINGKDAGIMWSFPFQKSIRTYLKPGENILKIEVNNLMANRLRDMDKKGIQWRKFHDINFISINVKPFDASGWEPQVSGLLGPVSIKAFKIEK